MDRSQSTKATRSPSLLFSAAVKTLYRFTLVASGVSLSTSTSSDNVQSKDNHDASTAGTVKEDSIAKHSIVQDSTSSTEMRLTSVPEKEAISTVLETTKILDVKGRNFRDKNSIRSLDIQFPGAFPIGDEARLTLPSPPPSMETVTSGLVEPQDSKDSSELIREITLENNDEFQPKAASQISGDRDFKENNDRMKAVEVEDPISTVHTVSKRLKDKTNEQAADDMMDVSNPTERRKRLSIIFAAEIEDVAREKVKSILAAHRSRVQEKRRYENFTSPTLPSTPEHKAEFYFSPRKISMDPSVMDHSGEDSARESLGEFRNTIRQAMDLAKDGVENHYVNPLAGTRIGRRISVKEITKSSVFIRAGLAGR
ncbi:hypothetical protein C8Q75DRAFT_758496 [Abortiporus biennis]|nr:hypothetical protein C8Q75DRAFT_758496 [Abortiporus biennis]